MQRVVATPDRRPCVVRRALVRPTRWQRVELEFDTGPPHGELQVRAHVLPGEVSPYAAPRPFVDEAASAAWFLVRAIVNVVTAPVVVPARVVARRPWLVEALCAEPGGRRAVRLTWWVVGIGRSRRFAADVAAMLERGGLQDLVAGPLPTPAR
jgi:hypothetical protein